MFSNYYPTASGSDYLRALAEERAAREQYVAAVRAQEEARERAARARALRNAYTSPNSVYYDHDYLAPSYGDLAMEIDPLDDGLGAYYRDPSPRSRPVGCQSRRPFDYGANPYAERAFFQDQRWRELMEEQRRNELLELEREKERVLLEEERIRSRILHEERQKEKMTRQKMLEEERIRNALEEERLRHTLRQEEASRERERAEVGAQQSSVYPLDILRALGLAPPASAPVSEEGLPRESASTPGVRRPTRTPIRPFPFGQTSTTQPSRATSTAKQTPSRSAPTNIPVSLSTNTPKSVSTLPSPQQLAAAEHIINAYRAYTSRKAALASIAAIRKRFLAARAGFAFPTTLDYDIAGVPTMVTLGPHENVKELARVPDVLQGAPRLAYSPTNVPLHGYEEELNRILGTLDAVESGGDEGVRAARRELARAVEKEAGRVERWRGVVWRWWVESQREAEKAAPETTENTEAVASHSEAQGVPTQVVERSESQAAASAAELQEIEVVPVATPLEVVETIAPTEVSMEIESVLALPHPIVQSTHTATSPSDATAASANILVPSLPPVVESAIIPDIEITHAPSSSQEAVLESALPATPALYQSEPEMEVEQPDVPTPRQDTYTALVVVDAERLPVFLHLAQKEPLTDVME